MAEIRKLAVVPWLKHHVPINRHEAAGEQPHAGNLLEGKLQDAENAS
jgi:hypothetical protein